MGFKWASALDWSSAAQRRVGWQLIGSVTLAGWGLSVKLFFFSHWGCPLRRCMHYWARGWPLCSLEARTNRSLVSRELHAHVCTVQAWNTLFRAGVAIPHSVLLFICSLRNLERKIPTFQTPTSQKKRCRRLSWPKSRRKRANISKVSWKIPLPASVKCHWFALHSARDGLNESSASSTGSLV